MVRGFGAGEVHGVVPETCFSGRRLEFGMVVGRPQVIFRGGKFFPGPILVINSDGLGGIRSVKERQLGEDGLNHGFAIFAPQGRDADKAGQPVGSVGLAGSIRHESPPRGRTG